MPKRRSTKFIVVHHAATKSTQDIGVREIRQWHIDRGFADVGYHYVIRRDGTLEQGRHLDEVGAHVAGHNSESIGICLVGGLAKDGHSAENNFTLPQLERLEKVLRSSLAVFPQAEVVGHRNLDPRGKPDCPAFDVKAWWDHRQTEYYAKEDDQA